MRLAVEGIRGSSARHHAGPRERYDNYQLTRKTPFEPKFFSLTNSLRLGLQPGKRRSVGTTIEIYFIGHSQHPPS